MAKKRTNIIPVIEDARHPHKYRMLIGEGLGVGSGCAGPATPGFLEEVAGALIGTESEWMSRGPLSL